MDLLRYVIAAIGSFVLGIVVALIGHSIVAGLGACVLLFLGYFLWSLVNDEKKKTSVQVPPVTVQTPKPVQTPPQTPRDN